MNLDEMTDEQLLDAWHAARIAHKSATSENRMALTALKLRAEAAAIRRFGVGEHMQAYRRRFADKEP